MTVRIVSSPGHDAVSLEAVKGVLQFTERSTEKPYAFVGRPPEGVAQTRGEYRAHSVPVHNARPYAARLSLDVEGFSLAYQPSAVQDFFEEAQTLALGHPEVTELVRNQTGATRVVVFDHTIRKRIDSVADREPDEPRQPAVRVHVDQTDWSGPKRVREIMGEQADALLARRAAIINVWRPIGYPARDWPLVLGDARSIDPQDLIASDLFFPHRRGETYGVAYNPAQRWLYVPDLAPDEVILIKCWDSDKSVARFAPHSGFEDPTPPPGTPPRQSIKFRTIAFFA